MRQRLSNSHLKCVSLLVFCTSSLNKAESYSSFNNPSILRRSSTLSPTTPPLHPQFCIPETITQCSPLGMPTTLLRAKSELHWLYQIVNLHHQNLHHRHQNWDQNWDQNWNQNWNQKNHHKTLMSRNSASQLRCQKSSLGRSSPTYHQHFCTTFVVRYVKPGNSTSINI